MNLFQKGTFRLHSGEHSDFKVDCDFLTDGDIETIAWMLNINLWKNFGSVEGVPTGGLRLASAMRQYACPDETDCVLIVDDVYTTGHSMHEQRADREDVLGVVIFARKEPEFWIVPFMMLGFI